MQTTKTTDTAINRARERLETEIDARASRSDPNTAGALKNSQSWRSQSNVDACWFAALRWALSVLLDEVLNERLVEDGA